MRNLFCIIMNFFIIIRIYTHWLYSFCFVLIDFINDYKKSSNYLFDGFYENCLYNGFYFHCYFLKLFFSMKKRLWKWWFLYELLFLVWKGIMRVFFRFMVCFFNVIIFLVWKVVMRLFLRFASICFNVIINVIIFSVKRGHGNVGRYE